MPEHRLGFGIVGCQAVADDLLVGIVETIVTQSPLLEPCHELVAIRAGEVEDTPHVDVALHEFRLGHVPGNPVEDEEIAVGLELPGLDGPVDRLVPEFHGHLVGNEKPLAGVLQKLGTERAGGVKRPEDITAGAMVEAGDLAENLALGPLSTSGGPEDQDGAVTRHHSTFTSGTS